VYTRERAEKNERLFRELNDLINEMAVALAIGPPYVEYVCECAREGCLDRIELTIPEYEELRTNRAHFAVIQGHELPDVEEVVAERERYTVVAKPWLAGDAPS
jgi:hypothetical protein